MDETEQKKPPTQVCSIRIMFPVDTDEQAIDYKKKITDVLSDIPQARIEFSLMSRPPLIPNGS
ncbi:hypothetical protein ES708_13412 [subsurface metagenome]